MSSKAYVGLQSLDGIFLNWNVQNSLCSRLLSLVLGAALGTSSLAGDYETQESDGYFEGALRYVVTRYSPRSGKALERKQISVLATENRLSIPSLDASDVFANNAPPGVSSALFRHDKEDFIVYGDDADAYRFSGYDMILMGMAFRALALTGAPMDMAEPEESGPFALRGFRTRLRRYRGEGNLRYDMYFTRDYKVKWGSLAESWLFGNGGLKVSGLSDALERGEVPVRVEAYRGEKKLLSINLMIADEYAIAPSLVEVPAQKILHSSTRLLGRLAAEAMRE